MEVVGIINILIPIMIGLAVIFFFWGLSLTILNSNKPEGRKNGRSFMLWGILALFILFTFSIFVGLISSELEIGNKTPNANTLLLPQ
mgnify:CR=1 FL=1